MQGWPLALFNPHIMLPAFLNKDYVYRRVWQLAMLAYPQDLPNLAI